MVYQKILIINIFLNVFMRKGQDTLIPVLTIMVIWITHATSSRWL